MLSYKRLSSKIINKLKTESLDVAKGFIARKKLLNKVMNACSNPKLVKLLKLKHGLLLHLLFNIKKNASRIVICRANGPIEYPWLQASVYQDLLVLSLLVYKRSFLLYRMNSKIDFRRHIAQKVCNVLHNRGLWEN